MTITSFKQYLLSESLVVEAVEDLKKQYKNIPEKIFDKAINLDPTYKGGTAPGKFAIWILNLVNNSFKNEKNQDNYDELIKKYPNGKDGKKFNPPPKLPEIKTEDMYKVPELLGKFIKYKNHLDSNISNYKTLADLDKAISGAEDEGLTADEKVLHGLDLFKKAKAKGLEIVFNNKNWIIGIPKTKASSVVFANDTSWCTTQNSYNYYEQYTRDGDLYINLDKKTGNLYQFHKETGSFMDENDSGVDIQEFFDNEPDLKDFYMKDFETKVAENDYAKLKKMLENERFKFESIKDGMVNFSGDYDSFKDCYYERGRDSISFDFIEKTLGGDVDLYFDGFPGDPDEIAQKVDEDQWSELLMTDKLTWKQVMEIWGCNGEPDDMLIEETGLTEQQIVDIYDILENNMSYHEGIRNVYRQCEYDGTSAVIYDNIINELRDNLPLISIDEKLHYAISYSDLVKYLWVNTYTEYNDIDILGRWRIDNADDNEYEFSIYENRYGDYGFDDNQWESALGELADKIRKIIS